MENVLISRTNFKRQTFDWAIMWNKSDHTFDMDTILDRISQWNATGHCTMSRPMGKPTICIGENKGADQLRGNREADQRLCFRYSDSTIPLLLKSEFSSFQPASVTVQPDLCQTCSETTLLVFPRGGSNVSDRRRTGVSLSCRDAANQQLDEDGRIAEET